jgi:hypothetical protein
MLPIWQNCPNLPLNRPPRLVWPGYLSGTVYLDCLKLSIRNCLPGPPGGVRLELSTRNCLPGTVQIVWLVDDYSRVIPTSRGVEGIELWQI